MTRQGTYFFMVGLVLVALAALKFRAEGKVATESLGRNCFGARERDNL